MKYSNNKKHPPKGMSLVEMVLAVAIMVVVMAVIARQFRPIQSNWGAKQAAAETIQNGRILTDHVNRNLVKAVQITDVSDSSVTLGYIQFEANDGNDFRYEVDPNGYVQFGEVGNLSTLAGPVTKFQFTCYDINDLDTPIIVVEKIRFVKAETILSNSASSGRNKTFTTAAYLQANANQGYGITSVSSFEYDTLQGKSPVLSKIDMGHYLCVYTAVSDNGWAIVLTVDTNDWSISEKTPFEFDTDKGQTLALEQIDDTHYLCVYQSQSGKGRAVVLIVDNGNWTISKATVFEFDTLKAEAPALVKIDDTHYLCVYQGDGSDGWSVVLTVNTGDWSISKETAFEFDSATGLAPALYQIDQTHYLCTYTGDGDDGTAVVLTVDISTWQISKETPFVFDSGKGNAPALSKIDDNRYLCAYTGAGTDGLAVVLTVNTGDWSISKGATFTFDAVKGAEPTLSRIDNNNFFCVYSGNDAWAIVLTIDPANWTITKEYQFSFQTSVPSGATSDIAQVDPAHYFCVYDGPGWDGWSAMMELNDGDLIRP